MTPVVFLLGAGFNADAAAQVNRLLGERGERLQVDARYPLVGDLWRICFNVTAAPGDSIEERFASALAVKDHAPLDRLCDALMEADYYLANRLSDPASAASCYGTFFDTFPESSFITFNYDALPEIFLYRRRRWQPDDGFGVPLVVERQDVSVAPGPSLSWVFHLHGSLYVYPQTMSYHTTQSPGRVDTELRDLAEPLFHFDADAVGRVFAPISRSMTQAYRHVPERVIAPVPDKASYLVEPFVQRSYGGARAVVDRAEHLVAIGYSFNDHDRESYHPILSAASNRAVTIVSLDALAVGARLRRRYPAITFREIPLTFAQWGRRGFPL